MRIKIWIVVLCFLSLLQLSGQNLTPKLAPVFKDDVVSRIDIVIPDDTIAYILAPGNEESDYHFKALFVFDNGDIRDTVENVGFRLRGNTSRYAQKKSFKVSFNTHEPGREWKGLEKLNLNGEHNDPTLSRAKICWDLLREVGVPAPRASHVNLYVNDFYFGVYANIEHIDENFVQSRFGNNDGNLYKCLYPADLIDLGTNPEDYKFEQNGRRAYELKTNQSQDDYSDLVQFIQVLNNTPTDELACAMEPIFNVNTFLKAMAVDILIGNWDGPLFNKNNFYLYKNERTGQFEYIPFDLDNTLGIDWFGLDWTERNIYLWGHPDEPRPLYWRLLTVTEYINRFSYFMSEILDQYFTAEWFEDKTSELKNLLSDPIAIDPFYPLNYGFSTDDFKNGFVEVTPYNHTKWGIMEFVNNRRSTALAQVADLDLIPIIESTGVSVDNNRNTYTFSTRVLEDEGVDRIQLCFQSMGSNEFTCVDMTISEVIDATRQQFIATIPIPEGNQLTYYVQVMDVGGRSSRLPYCTESEINNLTSNVSVAINEFMASNDTFLTDEAGEFDDWFELVNYGDTPVDLTGYFLTDNPNRPNKWVIPELILQPDEHLVFWADEDQEQGLTHTNFKLSANGEFIGLIGPDTAQIVYIDSFSFPEQTTDQAWGRIPNATGPFQSVQPTPGARNEEISEVRYLDVSAQLTLFPNPAEDYLRISSDQWRWKAIRLVNMLGQTQLELPLLQEGMISIDPLRPGIYSVLLFEKNWQFAGRIIKQ